MRTCAAGQAGAAHKITAGGPVVHIITRLEPGGSTRNVIDSAGYQAADREVVVITGPYNGKGRTAPEPPKNARYLELPRLVREISPLNDLRTLLELKKVLSALRPAIIHTHTAKAGILGRWAAWLYNLGKKKERAVVIHTPHGHVFYGYFGPFKTFIFALAERLTARVTDHFIALTEGERSESIAHGLGPAAKWVVIHSGVRFDDRELTRAGRDPAMAGDELTITVVARLEPVKGVEYFIRAAAELLKSRPKKKLRYLVVGDGPLLGGLKALAAALGVEKIVFAGFQQDVFPCLAASDIYVQPSLNEAMCRAVLEAQYMGLPVVASQVCGLRDTVKEGRTGLLAPPGDARALALALEKLIDNADLRSSLGKAARLGVLEKDFTGYPRFSTESMNIRLQNFYNKALGRHGTF
ncbi:MAG: glycosyltransferase family 4 protein [Elusimicrobiales bacterium]|jgi:glycosyltransferase involved in cell wall biosynthesis